MPWLKEEAKEEEEGVEVDGKAMRRGGREDVLASDERGRAEGDVEGKILGNRDISPTRSLLCVFILQGRS